MSFFIQLPQLVFAMPEIQRSGSFSSLILFLISYLCMYNTCVHPLPLCIVFLIPLPGFVYLNIYSFSEFSLHLPCLFTAIYLPVYSSGFLTSISILCFLYCVLAASCLSLMSIQPTTPTPTYANVLSYVSPATSSATTQSPIIGDAHGSEAICGGPISSNHGSPTQHPLGDCGETHFPTASPVQHSRPISPPSSGSVHPAIIVKPAPSLDLQTGQRLKATCLHGKLWGDSIPTAAMITRLQRDWSNIHGQVNIRYLGNGWFLINFSNPMDRDDIFNQRPWFVQGLNFTLLPWTPRFQPWNTSLSKIDQWVKIPFFPSEYWSQDYLTQVLRDIGQVIRLDKYTLAADDKGQFARVLVNIDISKQVPSTLQLLFDNDIAIYHLVYEGVHEVCSLCGATDHILARCPKKPPTCMGLMVAKLHAESSTSPSTTATESAQGWIHIKPRRRAKPRIYSRPMAPAADTSAPCLSPPNHEHPSTLPNSPKSASAIPTHNQFSTLADFQVIPANQIQLAPAQPLLSSAEEEAIDVAFIDAMGLLHQNCDDLALLQLPQDNPQGFPTLPSIDSSKLRRMDEEDGDSATSSHNN